MSSYGKFAPSSENGCPVSKLAEILRRVLSTEPRVRDFAQIECKPRLSQRAKRGIAFCNRGIVIGSR
jgi:hypothetical protein